MKLFARSRCFYFTCQINPYGLKHRLKIYGFRPTWPCLIIEVLGLPDLAWSLRFLQPEQNLLNHLHLTEPSPFCTEFFDCFRGIMSQFECMKHKFIELDYISHLSVQLSNHTWRETIHNVSVYQQDTINLWRSLLWLELLGSHDVHATN